MSLPFTDADMRRMLLSVKGVMGAMSACAKAEPSCCLPPAALGVDVEEALPLSSACRRSGVDGPPPPSEEYAEPRRSRGWPARASAIQKGTRVLTSLWDSLVFGRVLLKVLKRTRRGRRWGPSCPS